MNEKIKDLVAQLQNECRKEGVSLLCTTQKKGQANVVALGNIPDVGLCLAMQERHLDKLLPLPANILRTIAIKSLEENTNQSNEPTSHTFVLDDLTDLPDILARIIRGEFQ